MASDATTPVFCYGCNGVATLRSRCRNPTITAVPAKLPGYARCFAGWSERWGGAVSSIIQRNGSTCYGSIVHLNEEDLRLLDGFKGVYRVCGRRSN